MRKMIFRFFIFLPILMSCEEDEDKVIQTDLFLEAGQLFSNSKAWNESLYFAMISWEEYLRSESLTLPGCPEVSIDQSTKEVTLNFLSGADCPQLGKSDRKGKLLIKFQSTPANPMKIWTMEYVDYIFGTSSIEGIRSFSSDNSRIVAEDFNNIHKKTKPGLNTEFSGKFIHTKTLVNNTLASFTSVGRIYGVNAAGRDFEISIENPLNHLFTCYQQNEILPTAGKEKWFVSRGQQSEVNYTCTYELMENCTVSATAILPDGRKLLLNPKE